MTQLIIQPSNADSYIEKNSPNSNYGTETTLIIRRGGGLLSRGTLGFNFSSLPGGTEVTEALLKVYYYSTVWDNPAGLNIDMCRVTQTGWTEAGVTWNKYDGSNNWGTAGGDFTATNKATTTVPGSYGWMTWDVTDIVKYAQQNTNEIAHFLMKLASESSGTYWMYFRSNNYTGDLTQRPKLNITFKYLNGLWFGNG